MLSELVKDKHARGYLGLTKYLSLRACAAKEYRAENIQVPGHAQTMNIIAQMPKFSDMRGIPESENI